MSDRQKTGPGGAALFPVLLMVLFLAASAASVSEAAPIFRYTAPDGSILYTNMPMAPGQAERIFHDPPSSPWPEAPSGGASPKAASPGHPAAPTSRGPRAASHQIAHFPLVKQKGPWCVAASAEMVLTYHGFPRRQDDIAFAVYENRSAGTSLATIVRYINRIAGLRAWLRDRTDFEILKRCVDADVPVMVPLREPGRDEGHLAVVIGYDDGRQAVVLAEPATGSTVQVPYREFLRVWTGTSVTVTPTRL